MINATERKKQKLTYDFCNALDRNPYDPTLLAFLVREANIDYVSRAQRIRAQENRGNLLRALTGGLSVQVFPSHMFSEQGYATPRTAKRRKPRLKSGKNSTHKFR
jgi:hypothetical protein